MCEIHLLRLYFGIFQPSLSSDDNDSANQATIEQNQKFHERKGREKTFRRDKLGVLQCDNKQTWLGCDILERQ